MQILAINFMFFIFILCKARSFLEIALNLHKSTKNSYATKEYDNALRNNAKPEGKAEKLNEKNTKHASENLDFLIKLYIIFLTLLLFLGSGEFSLGYGIFRGR